MNPYVKLNVEDGIGTIEFFHPQSNSLPGEILQKLADTITETGNNNEVLVVVLKSGGDRTFCSGASFDELMAIENDITIGQFDIRVIGNSTMPSNKWGEWNIYMEAFQAGLIDKQEALKKTEIFDKEGVLQRTDIIAQLQGPHGKELRSSGAPCGDRTLSYVLCSCVRKSSKNLDSGTFKEQKQRTSKLSVLR